MCGSEGREPLLDCWRRNGPRPCLLRLSHFLALSSLAVAIGLCSSPRGETGCEQLQMVSGRLATDSRCYGGRAGLGLDGPTTRRYYYEIALSSTCAMSKSSRESYRQERYLSWRRGIQATGVGVVSTLTVISLPAAAE